MRNSFITLTLLLVIAIPWVAVAGPGANMNACIHYPVRPIKPLVVEFKRGNWQSMNESGQDSSMNVSEAGLTCTSVGYVEAARFLNPQASRWEIGYTIIDSPKSGSTNTNWKGVLPMANKLELLSASPGTALCLSAHLCNVQYQEWASGTQGPLYIIFQPEKI